MPTKKNLSIREVYCKAPFFFNAWKVSFPGSYPTLVHYLLHLFALVLSVRPLSFDLFFCLKEGLGCSGEGREKQHHFWEGWKVPAQTEDKTACLLRCSIASPNSGIASVFLGYALVSQCSITALWNLSVSMQLDIKGVRSQPSDFPLGTESSFA